MNVPVGKTNATQKRRRLWRHLTIVSVLLVAFVLVAPLIIANTGLRDQLINKVIGTPNLTASAQNASFGWLSPLSVEHLTIKGKLGHFRAEVEKVVADRSWPRLLASSPQLGMITVTNPHIFVHLPLGDIGERTKIIEPTCTAVIQDAALTVYPDATNQPVIDVDGVNMKVHIDQTEVGRMLCMDPVVIFKQRPMRPEAGNKLLQLMNPCLADSTQTQGQYSLSIEKFRIPLDGPSDQMAKRVEVEGKLGLHQVSIESKSPLLHAMIKPLADLYGKDVPETIRFVKNNEFRFQVRDGRMYHEGLQLGFPDIDPNLMVRSSGSVGLDQTIDVSLEVPRLDSAKNKEKGPVFCRVTGTLSNPKLDVRDASLVVRIANARRPLLDVDGVDLSFAVESDGDLRVLKMAPARLLDKQHLSRAFNDHLLHLLAPGIEDLADVKGQISLSVEKLQLPLNVAPEQVVNQTTMAGKLQLHELSTTVKALYWDAIIKVLADLYGKKPPEAVRIVNNSDVRYELRNGRMYHQDLHIGFPDISPNLLIRTSGSVGLDQTLDLALDIPRLDAAKLKEKGPVQCRITGTLSQPKINVKDASLVLRLAKDARPLLDIDGVDITATVVSEKGVRKLALEPVQVLDRQNIRAAFNNELMKLAVPSLGDLADVRGEVSLFLDKCQIPLGVSDDELSRGTVVAGRMQLHQVSTTIKSPTLEVMAKVLADLYGKKPSQVIRIAKDADLRFEIREGRLYHESARIGFPDIDPNLQVTTSGSVGLDETLDLQVELPRLDAAKRKEKGSIHCKITGTISQPQMTVKDASLVLRLGKDAPPLLDVDGIDLNINVENKNNIRTLSLAPVQIFDKQNIRAAFTHEIVNLIAPTMGDVADVRGEISLALDKCRIPIDLTGDELIRESELSGRLKLHQISTTTKTPIIETTVKLLADLYGKKPSEIVRVAKDADVRFWLRDGRLHQDGLRIGFPDISADLIATCTGSIGFDKSLDFVLDLPRVPTKRVTGIGEDQKGRVRFKITGTPEKPNVIELKEP